MDEDFKKAVSGGEQAKKPRLRILGALGETLKNDPDQEGAYFLKEHNAQELLGAALIEIDQENGITANPDEGLTFKYIQKDIIEGGKVIHTFKFIDRNNMRAGVMVECEFIAKITTASVSSDIALSVTIDRDTFVVREQKPLA